MAALIGSGKSVDRAVGGRVTRGWPWAYAMLLGTSSLASFTCSTRVRRRRGAPPPRSAVHGGAAAAGRLGNQSWADRIAAWRGLAMIDPPMPIRALTLLGEYNLRGALALIAIALAMLAAAKHGWRTALVAAVVSGTPRPPSTCKSAGTAWLESNEHHRSGFRARRW